MLLALAESCGKKVGINFECTNLKVERKNLELLEGIFVHLMRNAIDHGIEFPEERLALRKPESGNIKIELREDSQKFIVRICDDGKGIDLKAVRADALRKGKITREESQTLNDEQTIALLFMPGVSTTKTVGEISGRGVGMDVVANTIKNAGGSIHMESKLGLGTTIELCLPCSFSGK
jgi:two-component system chemotaxis sensor kinase CheA